MKCNFSLKSFRQELLKQAAPIIKNSDLSDAVKKQKLLDTVADISKTMGISAPSDVEQALNLVIQIFSKADEAQRPDENLIRAAFTAWRNKPESEAEDNSSERLNKDQTERFNDDVWESAYGSAMNAKIRAKQQASKVGVQSLLYNENGIIGSTCDLNASIQEQQEKLLSNVIEYLKTRIPVEEQIPIIFQSRMYKNGIYTGIVEILKSKYNNILGSENFDVMSLNKDFNNKNYQRLDAYSSWIILNNFDTIMQQLFGKAIAINPDSPKYTTARDKYIIAGGSNVYNTWRTSDEINLSKEINNITQLIVTSLPLIPNGSTTPSDQNIKFNEFTYIISKLKDLPYKASKDYTFSIADEVILNLSEKTQNYIEGKSILNIINGLRDNPQEILPIIFEIFGNNNLRDFLQGQGVIDGQTFLDVDLDIINSLNLGLFNGPNSLEYIQSKSSYQNTNYFSFIAQTIDSIYKAGFLQYFRDPDGKIYVRNMFDQSVNNIQFGIQDTINSINSQTFIQNYDDSKYNISEIKQKLGESNVPYRITYNGDVYDFIIQNGSITAVNKSKNNTPVQETELLYKLAEEYRKQKGVPEVITFEVKNFHKGPLDVFVNVTNGKISYYVEGKELTAFNNEDYESLSEIIQDVLKQNFIIDQKYFSAFNKGQVGNATTQLMQLVSRVIANQYISNHYLKGLIPRDIRRKLNEIFGEQNSSFKPTINKKLNEINLLTEEESGILSVLAQAKALVTGRLTSSQVLDGEGNALATSSLSRFMSSIPYQVLKQVRKESSPANNFLLWNQGVYLGIQQLKEIQDNSNDTSKPLTEFSAREMEEGAIFIDFLQSLMPEKSRTSPIKEGIAAFLPSENSDKTYIGRMMINLKKIQIGDQSLYDILKTGKHINGILMPIIAQELGGFYQKALDNINEDWNKVKTLLNLKVLELNDPELTKQASPISYGNWEYLNLVASKLGVSPLKLVQDLTTEFNNKNPQNPIVLIDQVHYVSNKNGELEVNKSLLENVERFKIGENDYFSDFIQEQEADLLQTLLKDKVSITANEDFKLLLGDEANKWIDPYTGKVILAFEYTYDSESDNWESIPIRRMQDIKEGFEINPVHDFILNPLIANYNLLNYLFTQEFMNSTVGAFYAHPSKDKTGTVVGDEKSRKLAQDKRNVSFTAAMHSFLKNLVQGIPDEINIALMPDTIDQFETISGDVYRDITPLDGATFGNPFFTILENNSLGGARVGINKKTFTHYYDERTGTGGIIKTAEFPLTNNNIRNSKFYQIMMKNMTDRIWLNEDGTPAIVDITKDYNDQPILFTNPNSQENGQLYFQNSDGRYYAIIAISSQGNNSYFRVLQEVDKTGKAIGEQVIEDINGNLFRQGEQGNFQNIETNEVVEELQPKIVDTNYKLWKLFGGERAMELKIGDSTLTPTEHSINIVVNIMNNAPGRDNEGKPIKKAEIIKYQSQIWQPLKHSDIHLMPTVGAVKQGAGNINSLDAYRIADSSKINFMRIKMNQAGIQLDKEHHADGDELSIMTQVISACASRGYTQEQAQDMYNAMAALARAGIREYLDAFNEFFQSPTQENKDKYQEVILNTLLDAFAHNTNTSQMLQMVTLEILNKAKEGKDIAFNELNKISYSDPSVFRRLHSTISVALTKAAIKIKVDGILSVLQPSYNAVKLYDDKLFGSFVNEEQIQTLQSTRDLDPAYELRHNISKIKIGRTYKFVDQAGNITYRTIKTHNDYYRLKDYLLQNPESIVSIREQFAPVEGQFEGGRELAAYNAEFSSLDGRSFNLYDLASVRGLARLKLIDAPKEEIKEALEKLQIDLNILKNKQGKLIIDSGEEIELNPQSIIIEPYEIVMPKIFKDIFGLDTYDDLNEIKNDPEFFTKRLLEKIQVKIPNSRYSLALLKLNGKHTYLLKADEAVEVPGEFERKTIHKFKDKGKYWRVNSSGKKLYQMNKDDEVWSQIVNGKEVEVIVTKNISSYLKTQKFNTLSISPKTDWNSLILILQNSKKWSIKNYLNALNQERENGSDYLGAIENLSYSDLEGHPLEKYFRTLGAQIHNSFLKSLGIVAARIPAQSMQSFMPMKVVAFDAPDINTAYVNTAHFLFEGSDLDIDAVSLAAYAFDNSGRYLLHSPFANINTYENLEASEELPFPTGETYNTISKEVGTDYNLYIGDYSNPNTPFVITPNEKGKNSLSIDTSTPEKIRRLGEFLRLANRGKGLPQPLIITEKGNKIDKSISRDFLNLILSYVNEHNQFINDESVEEFSKNYIVTSMYKIGINPANLIESQQALDSITKPLKDAANSTKKANEEKYSLGNVGSCATNIHGITQNMAGKKGVGICAVGLKSYFAATARYNEVLAHGTPEEVERLKSDVEIAGKHFKMLANVYTTNLVNSQILGEIYSQLDQGQDQALILSALLSLATDNAKELALDKLNASNFLGMYIYGITIGMDFQTLANIISSDTGRIINDLMSSNAFSGERGLNIQNIFDYIELGPQFTPKEKLSSEGGIVYSKYLTQEALWDLAWNNQESVENKIKLLEGLKIKDDQILNNIIEQAEEYIEQINTIKTENVITPYGRLRYWNQADATRKEGEDSVYSDIKKLSEGGEELRKQGQLLHINQGLETQYSRAINYIETVTSVISDRKYSNYRELKRKTILKNRREGTDNKLPQTPSGKWKFNFHNFVMNSSYRNAWIDVYGGLVNDSMFLKDEVYRQEFIELFDLNPKESPEKNLKNVKIKITSSPKVFFNILDTMQVPHFLSYLEASDMLHQAMMKTSAKYRAIYTLGKDAIDYIGAFSEEDKENILKRTEQFVDRIIRDRFLVQQGYEIRIPRGQEYFIEQNGKLQKKIASSSDVIIQLGTRAGNASFKALMENRIIPDLQEGKIGGNMKDSSISHNTFIQSLSPVLYKQNPEYSVTINYAPNINMSPRSDTDKALFEQIKYDFNQLRVSSVRYQIGPNRYDLIELFWLYNQISFNGRPGENTLTSIFTDLFDYKVIKQFRDYINDFDNNHDLRETISLSKMIREVAPKANVWSTKLKHFYYEDPRTGRLAFWSKATRYSEESLPPDIEINQINGYEPSILSYTIDGDLKNFQTISQDQDIRVFPLKITLENGVASISIQYGGVSKIVFSPLDQMGNPDVSQEREIKIPKEYKKFFKQLPTKTIITADGVDNIYDVDKIARLVDNLINCG